MVRIASVVLFLAVATAAQDADVLARYGIEPTREGLTRYFATFLPDKKGHARIAAGIRALQAPREPRREHGIAVLLRAGVGALDALDEATKSIDPDVSRHARSLARRARIMRNEATLAALRTIKKKKISGMTRSVLSIAPFCDDRVELRHLVERALLATAGTQDVGHIRAAIAGGKPAAQAPAILALGHVLGTAARSELVRRMTDPCPRVAVAAARAAANVHEPLCLPALVELLESDDVRTRREAAHVLRVVTGKRFGFANFDKEESRQAAAARWRRFVAGHEISAKWKVPVRLGRAYLGRTLMVIFNEQKVVELDAAGRDTWTQKGLPGVWAVAGSPDGFRAVGLINSREVILFNGEGRELWRTKRLPGYPIHLSFAGNGHVLVCCGGNGPNMTGAKILELDESGRTVWQYALNRGTVPLVAQRLDSGHTLIATNRRVFALRPNGKVVWEHKAIGHPFGVGSLPDGRILIFDRRRKRIVELDTNGRQIRTRPLPGTGNYYYGQALPNGRFLFSQQNRAMEIDAKGRVFWEHRGQGPVKAVRY